MASNQYAYAIYFAEGTGFLYCDHIASGSEAVVSLVRSRNSQSLFVRKKGADQHRPFVLGHEPNPEVRYYQSGLWMPKLEAFKNYRPLKPDHQDFYARTSTATIWSYCNTGNLYDLVAHYRQARANNPGSIVRVPEQFIWALLASGLSTLRAYQLHNPPIAHKDILPCNIFLHRFNPGTLPVCKLADFGKAVVADLNSANPTVRQIASVDLFRDYDDFITLVVKALMVLHDEDDNDNKDDINAAYNVQAQSDSMLTGPNNQPLPRYSTRLYSTVRLIETTCGAAMTRNVIPDFSDLAGTCLNTARYIAANPTRVYFTQVPAAVQGDGIRTYSQQPLFFRSRRGLLDYVRDTICDYTFDDEPIYRVPGPIKIAKVNLASLQVIALSKDSYFAHRPQSDAVLQDPRRRRSTSYSITHSERDRAEDEWDSDLDGNPWLIGTAAP